MSEKQLDQVKTGQKVVVLKIAASGRLRQRIMDMGITKGITLNIKRVAPLGDPVELTVRGYNLSLRKEEAAQIIVEVSDNV